jgi:hypothetical protein
MINNVDKSLEPPPRDTSNFFRIIDSKLRIFHSLMDFISLLLALNKHI